MESFVDETHHVKIPPLVTQEAQKKKKSTKKKTEVKPPKSNIQTIETIPEPNNDLDLDLVHYAYKLESELTTTKRKLKLERKKFRQIISSLAKYLDSKGTTSTAVDEYLKTINHQASEHPNDSEYDKLFTTHKYQITDSTDTQQNESSKQKGPFTKKIVSKTPTNQLKSIEQASTNENTTTASPHAELQTISGDQSMKGSTPKPRKNSSANTGKTVEDQESKKRRQKKEKAAPGPDPSDEVIEIQEISPPPESKAKKDSNTFKADDRSRFIPMPMHPQNQMGNINPLEVMMTNPNMLDEGLKVMLQQMQSDPTNLMNAYLMMAGNQGLGDPAIMENLLQQMGQYANMGVANQLFGSDKNGQPSMNYYQGAFK